MSAVLANASPRRIKATHRRRRKVAAGHFVQRYYDPQVGRFLSVDPMASDMNNAWNFNSYNYAANSPYKFTDPDGRIADFANSSVGPFECGQCETAERPTQLTEWPVPGWGDLNQADKPGEGRGEFGTPRTTGGPGSTHAGIDIQAPTGASVVAAASGSVVNIQPNPSETYGNQVVMNHGAGVYTQSAHLSSTTVEPGQYVRAGEQIGTVGTSGNTPRSGDSHLHFEVRIGSSAPRRLGGTTVDPMSRLPAFNSGSAPAPTFGVPRFVTPIY